MVPVSRTYSSVKGLMEAGGRKGGVSKRLPKRLPVVAEAAGSQHLAVAKRFEGHCGWAEAVGAEPPPQCGWKTDLTAVHQGPEEPVHLEAHACDTFVLRLAPLRAFQGGGVGQTGPGGLEDRKMRP